MNYQITAMLGCVLLWTAVGQAAPIYTSHLLYNTDPAIYWRLDEVVGTTARDAAPGGPYHGTYVNTYTRANVGPRPADGLHTMNPGNVAAGATGNGAVRHTELYETAEIPTGSYSYQMWFNSSVSSWDDRGLQYVFTRGNDGTGDGRRDAVYIGGAANPSAADRGKLALLAGAGTGTTWGTRVLDPDRWYHLVYVRSDYADPNSADPDNPDMIGSAQLFLNGKLEVESAIAWQGGDGDYLTAGHRTDMHTGYGGLGFYGRFDEVAMWDRPLGEAEVKNLYFGALGSPYLASVLRKEPEAYWRLEETTGTNIAYDSTGNGHSFTYHATPSRTGEGTDVGPRPLEFGGMPADNKAPTLTGQPLTSGDGYVGIVNNVLPDQNDYSAELWFRPGIDSNPHNDYVLHRGTGSNSGDYLGVASSGGEGTEYTNVFFYNGLTSSIHGSTQLSTGQWYHLAMSREGDNITVYLNGLEEISTTLDAAGGLTTGQWAFGGRSDMPGQQKFSGGIDEIAVYGAPLGGDAFQENYLSAIVQRDVPYAKTVLRYAPESYWRLDEVSPYTLAIDATGHGHTFTYHASVSRTGNGEDVGARGEQYPGLGSGNNAPRLTGGPLGPSDNGYLGIVNDLLPDRNDYSAQLWFRPGIDSNPHSDYLIHRGTGRDSGDFLGLRSSGTGHEYTNVFFYDGDSSVLGTTPLVTGEWYHVAMVRDGNDVAVYLNGQPEISTTRVPTSITGQWAFGGRSDLPGQQKFTGNMDEIAVYARPLSKFHVQASYLSALPRDESDYSQAVLATGPEAYWRLNEGPEWVAAMDSSGNAHHFEYHAAVQRGAEELGPRPSNHHLGFETDNIAPRLTGGPRGSLTNGYLGIVDGVLPSQNDYTAEMWFRRDAVGNLGAYLMHRSDLDASSNTGDFLGVRNDSDNNILFVYDGDSSAGRWGTTEILEDEWYHLAMVREGDDVLVYLNSQLEIDVTMAPRSATKWVDGTWAFGGRVDSPSLDQRFAGSLDEIAIYGRALSQEEIRAHYLVGVPEPSTALLLALAGLSLAGGRRRRRRPRHPALECGDSSPLSIARRPAALGPGDRS